MNFLIETSQAIITSLLSVLVPPLIARVDVCWLTHTHTHTYVLHMYIYNNAAADLFQFE